MVDNNLKDNKKLFRTLLLICAFGIALSILKWVMFKPAKMDEKTLYNAFYEASGQISSDKQQRKKIADCCIEQIKSRFPNIDDIYQDSIKQITEIMVANCVKVVTKISWTPFMEKAAIKKVSSLSQLKNATVEQRTAYAQCVLLKLKSKYPNGLNGRIPQEEMDQIYMGCAVALK